MSSFINIKFRCPTEVHERLDEYKTIQGVSAQHVCVEALRQYLNRDPTARLMTYAEWNRDLKDLVAKYPDLFRAEVAEGYKKWTDAVVQYLSENPEVAVDLARAQGWFPVNAANEKEQQALLGFQMFLRETPEDSQLAVQTIILQMLVWFRSSRRKLEKPDAEEK